MPGPAFFAPASSEPKATEQQHGFYNPMQRWVAGKQVIVYPCKGVENVLDRSKKGVVGSHLEALYRENKLYEKGQYHIVMLWVDGKDLMTDVWMFDKVEAWGSGPLAYQRTFRGMVRVTDMGEACEDGLILLGKEGESRRSIRDRITDAKAALEEYLIGGRPKLPQGLGLGEDFYMDPSALKDPKRQ